MTMKSFLEFL